MTEPTKIIPFRRPKYLRLLPETGPTAGFPRFARERDRLPLPLHLWTKEQSDERTPV